MKIKVKLFNRQLLKNYLTITAIIATIGSFVFIFVTLSNLHKVCIGILFAIILIAIYFFLWIKSNRKKNINLSIGNSNVIVKIGDIFQEEGLKVIAFNEYFDTVVDNSLISSSSLNGKFINNYVADVNALDNSISNNTRLSNPTYSDNVARPTGKTVKYKLGSVHEYDDYLLTAFSKFDDTNRAYLTMTDYVNCLLNFWNEVDIVYASRSVSIPLFGTGITRVDGHNTMTDQEKLELLLWSFKVSKIKFTYPSNVTIVIHKSKQDKINFYKLKGDNDAI